METLFHVASTATQALVNSVNQDKDTVGSKQLEEPKGLRMRQTFCMLYMRNFHFYIRNIRNTTLLMALITAIMQITFFYKVGEMEKPPATVFLFFGLDTWVVASTFQTIMTIKAVRLFEREKREQKMKYSPSSFFLAHWFSSFMSLKIYGVVSCTISFWFIALPKLQGIKWFNFFCMELVLTMCAISLG